ncbi:MAG: ribosome biogenesis GTPase YlqF [Firmicutes bacterium]|nr:ribosome biogenesis GTPase YlqF [Bacillota bacterium]
MNIQWYPGHMVKAQKTIAKELKLVDIIIEMLDARIPISSRNPEINTIVGNKKSMIVLNKSDLADENVNEQWKDYFYSEGITAIFVDSLKGKGIKDVLIECRKMMKDDISKKKSKGIIHKTIRTVIIGIPNVGKSSFINKVVNRSIAKTGGIPGITKTKQWIKISKDFELLDTPGILWPKFDDEIIAQNLAFTGAIKDEIMDVNELSKRFLLKGLQEFPEKLNRRYNFHKIESVEGLLQYIGKKRGCLLAGGEIDINRVSALIMEDFRTGKLGRISLERPKYKGR